MDVPQEEADTLIWLYNNGNGPSWYNQTNWKKSTTVGTWYGITVSGGHVTAIALYNNNGYGDISGFDISVFADLSSLLMFDNNFSGDISTYAYQSNLRTISIGGNNFTGDLSGVAWPSGLTALYLRSNEFTGDLSGTDWPVNLATLHLYGNAFTGSGSLVNNTRMSNYRYDNNGLSQADVDAVLQDIYTYRFNFPASPVLNIGGDNASPSGVYQDGDPPTTGKEYAYELENDPEGEGFNTWAITYS